MKTFAALLAVAVLASTVIGCASKKHETNTYTGSTVGYSK